MFILQTNVARKAPLSPLAGAHPSVPPRRCPAAAPPLPRSLAATAPPLPRSWAATAPSQPRRTRSCRLAHLGEVPEKRVHARQVRERAAGGRALGRRRRRQRSRAVGPRQHHDAGSQTDLVSAGDVG